MTALDLARVLLARGARLGLDAEGVWLEGPDGAVTDELRLVADTLLGPLTALVESVEERAAIYEHDAGLPRDEAELQSWADALTFHAPSKAA